MYICTCTFLFCFVGGSSVISKMNSDITMTDIIQEMDTPEHEYGEPGDTDDGSFAPDHVSEKYYSDAQRQHLRQQKRMANGGKTPGGPSPEDIILDEVPEDNLVPNPPQISSLPASPFSKSF